MKDCPVVKWFWEVVGSSLLLVKELAHVAPQHNRWTTPKRGMLVMVTIIEMTIPCVRPIVSIRRDHREYFYTLYFPCLPHRVHDSQKDASLQFAELLAVYVVWFVSGYLKLSKTNWTSVSLVEQFVAPMPPVCTD
jgi:hypothetical protein